MTSGGDEATRPSVGPVWSSISGLLAFVAALGAAFDALPKLVLDEKQQWMTAFLPDLIVILLLNAVAPLVVRRIDWRQSIVRVRAHSRFQLGILCTLAILTVILLVPVANKARELYRIRYEEASIDWHAVEALHYFGVRQYDAAAKELKLASPTSLGERHAVLHADLEGRFRDAESLVKRSRASRIAGQPPTFSELLMVARAARLAPLTRSVDEAMTEARTILVKALDEYVAGIANIRNGDGTAAAKYIRNSKAICRGLLHQDLLLRYAENQNLATYSAEDRGLIRYYLEREHDALKSDLMAYPPIRQFVER